MARAQASVYNRYIEIMEKHERGELKGQSAKISDAKGGMKSPKLYHFRHINNMEIDAAHAVLDLVISGDLLLGQLKEKSKEVEQLMKVQSALMGQLNLTGENFTMWEEVEKKFPHHTTYEQLVSMFGSVSKLDE